MGKTPIIRYHYKNWKRFSSIGVIACKADGSDLRLLLRFVNDSVNKEDVVEFLDVLHREIEGRIVLLWDGLRAHRSNLVKEHVYNNRDWLMVERFPSYAPELNPVEYLWSPIKGRDVANLCSDTIDQVREKVEQAGHRIGSEQKMLQGFLLASGLFEESELVNSSAETQ